METPDLPTKTNKFYTFALIGVIAFILGLKIGEIRPTRTEDTAYLRNAPFDPNNDFDLMGHAEECALVVSGPSVCKETYHALVKRIRRTR